MSNIPEYIYGRMLEKLKGSFRRGCRILHDSWTWMNGTLEQVAFEISQGSQGSQGILFKEIV